MPRLTPEQESREQTSILLVRIQAQKAQSCTVGNALTQQKQNES